MPLALATTPLSLAAIFKLQEVKNTINRENIAHAKVGIFSSEATL